MADDRCQPLQGSPACRGSQGRESGHGPRKKELSTKIHLAVDAHGMPVRVLVTQGPTADCTEAGGVMEGIVAQCLIAERVYDSDAIIEQSVRQGMKPVIPPRKNRTRQRPYDRHLYKLRHLVENAFLHLKRWRGIATRYARNSASFLAAIQIGCIALWL